MAGVGLKDRRREQEEGGVKREGVRKRKRE
jgi:hypothetical protein